MNMIDIIILVIVVGLFLLAFYFYFIKNKGSECASCSKANRNSGNRLLKYYQKVKDKN